MKMVELQSNNEVVKTKKLTTLASIESLSMPEVHEVVFLADFRCLTCQERVAEVMSKMNGEMQSVVVSVRKKEVTLTCTNPKIKYVSPIEIGPVYSRKSSLTKLGLIIKLLFSNRS